jgi:hypothetical protein
MLLSVAPEEMIIKDVFRLTKKTITSQAWEVQFRVDNLHGLKKIIKHLDRSSLQYLCDFEA